MSKLELPRIHLPTMTFHLPARHINLDKEVKELKVLTRKAGQGSGLFQSNFLRIFRELEQGNFSPRSLQTTNEVRAYLTIATRDEIKAEVKNRVKIEPALLEQFAEIRSPMSRLSLMMLIQLYFQRFEHLVSSTAHFECLCQFLKQQVTLLDTFRKKKGESDLARYAEFASILFSTQAPHQIVNLAKQNHKDFTHALQRMGIEAFKNGRLLKVSQTIYYLEELKSIPLGEHHPILLEVTKPDVIRVQYDKHYWLGHKVIEILIDRTVNEGGVLSDVWQNVILDIADDPRIASELNLNQWWRPLGEARIEQMRSWLSRHDLKLFLKLLEQSARDLGNESMERMFAGRKRFLEALFDGEHIRYSRLFFSNEAARYLRSHYTDQKRLSAYARVTGDASVIYLRLKNGWHLVEGTHSFKLRYLDQLPSNSNINNYHQASFTRDEVAGGLDSAYYVEFRKELYSTAHDSHSNWKFRLLDWFNKTGIHLEMNKVVTQHEYLLHRARHGA